MSGSEVSVKVSAPDATHHTDAPSRFRPVEVPAAEHPHSRRVRFHRPGRWIDGALHGTIAQHPRRSGPLEQDGQCDDWGVKGVSFQSSLISYR